MRALDVRTRTVEGAYSVGFRRLSQGGALAVTKRRSDRVVKSFNQAQITWVVSPGRTGTKTLSHLLNQLPGVRSEHEPDPQYRHVLRGVDTRRCENAVGFLVALKVPATLWAARNHAYVETSHLFSKGLFEASLALGLAPQLLCVTRDPAAVASSLLKINAVPGRSRADQYLLRPSDEAYLSLGSQDGLSPYQLCLWYALEIQLRAELYKQVALQAGLSWVSMSTSDMNDVGAMTTVAEDLGLADRATAESAFEGIVGQRLNTKIPSPAEIDDPDRQHADLLARVVRTGIAEDVFERIERIRKRLGIGSQ